MTNEKPVEINHNMNEEEPIIIDKNSLPTTPYGLFAKLYRAKQRKLNKDNKSTSDVMRIWKSLSKSQTELFINKFKELQSKHNEFHANYLLTAEPFMKKKHKGLPVIDNKNIKESNCEKENKVLSQAEALDDTLQPLEHFSNNTSTINNSEIIKESNCENGNEVPFNAETLDKTSQLLEELSDNTSMLSETTLILDNTKMELSADLDMKSEPEEQIELETNSVDPNQQKSLLEPTPPTVKNGRELFESLKFSNCGATWFQLNKNERRRYTSAVTKLKNRYLKQYKEYLESLSSLELFNHYVDKSLSS